MNVSRHRGRSLRGAVVLTLLVSPLAADSFTRASATAAQSAEPPLGASLSARMASLFTAIAAGSLPQGERLFFPEPAYVSMKTGRIANPTSDFTERLIGFFRLDVVAYHAYLVSRGHPRFLGASAISSDAMWIRPGWCENSIGYWHLPGVRLIYAEGHQVRSVGVASLISWHGVWYVVHLGPNPRPRDVGTVDAPALGRGVPGPAGGC